MKPAPMPAAAPAPAPAPARNNTVAAIAPGSVVADRYLVERQIGSGGTAQIFCVRDMHVVRNTGAQAGTQPRIALKSPRPGADRDREVLRLRREFECLQSLAHPNIVRAHELHCPDEGECFMTLELVEGRTLSSLQREWSPFPAALAYKILEACGRALQHAHRRGVVHGDFTPGNVLITHDEQVKILDFGAGSTETSRDDERIAAGTRAYASPEVLSGLPPEPRDDIFSFACVAYELLVGRHPFDRRSSLESREAEVIPPRAGSLTAPQWFALVGALAWNREDRVTTLEALLTTLQDARPSVAKPIAPLPRSGRSFSQQAVAAARSLPDTPAASEDIWPRRNTWGLWLFAAAAVILTLLIFR